MFYFTPPSSPLVKRSYLKDLGQNVLINHPCMQLEDQTPHPDHRIGTDQLLSLRQRIRFQYADAADLATGGKGVEQRSIDHQLAHFPKAPEVS